MSAEFLGVVMDKTGRWSSNWRLPGGGIRLDLAVPKWASREAAEAAVVEPDMTVVKAGRAVRDGHRVRMVW